MEKNETELGRDTGRRWGNENPSERRGIVNTPIAFNCRDPFGALLKAISGRNPQYAEVLRLRVLCAIPEEERFLVNDLTYLSR
jgi:hypothetical protein